MRLAVNGTSERWILPIKAKKPFRSPPQWHPSPVRPFRNPNSCHAHPPKHSEARSCAVRFTQPNRSDWSEDRLCASKTVAPARSLPSCQLGASTNADRPARHAPNFLSIPRLMRGCSPCFTHNPEPLQRSHQTGDCWRGTNRRRVGPTRDDSRGCATTGAAMQATGGAHEKSFENKG